MKQNLLMSHFLCFSVFSVTLLCQETSKENKIWEDERIGITVDRVERVDSYPKELRMPGIKYASPDKGNDFVFVYITVVKVKEEDIKIRLDDTHSVSVPKLIDSEGKAYETIITAYTWSSRDESLIGKGKAYFWYELPKDVYPTRFQFIYPYREKKLNPEKLKSGQIDIELSQK